VAKFTVPLHCAVAIQYQFPDVLQVEVKYGGLDASELKRMKDLEAENAKLKRMNADMALKNVALKDLIEKKL
jgi:putative transposase